jgi:glycosyltransferase involved in cell wall biosynthesis
VRLSLIIPVHNGREVLPRCLEGIARGARAPDEVIVVDDGSDDDTGAVVRAHGATLGAVAGPPRGPAAARNRGAARATGDVLVFVDADVVVHADMLSRVAATFETDPGLHALFGSYDDNPAASGTVSRFKNLLHHYVHQHSKRDAGSFWAACGAIRREAFVTAGGFDERYAKPSVEDIELGIRLKRAGLSIRLCPEIQVTHLKRWSLMGLWRTDVLARAVPWTRLLLREGSLPDELNLAWRSRVSALVVSVAASLLLTTLVLLALREVTPAGEAALGAATCLLASTFLNLELYRFFVRRGGVRFAAGCWLLHHVYLVYSCAVFAVLVTWDGLALRAAPRAARARHGTP